jgi:uncharacterized sulfatase
VALVDGWKLQVNERSPWAPWLFDLNTDATEQVNLAEREPERVAALQAALDAHNAEQEPPTWPSQIEAAINVDESLEKPDTPDDEYVYWPN